MDKDLRPDVWNLSSLVYASRRVNGRFFNKPFPPNTSGFLYYFRPPFAPPHLGEVRFRITGKPDPDSFSLGRDLPDLDGVLPFTLEMRSIAHGSIYRGLAQLLLEDGLATEELFREISKLFPVRQKRRIIYAFNQPFHLSLPLAELHLGIIGTEDGKLLFENMRLVTSRLSSRLLPYRGLWLHLFLDVHILTHIRIRDLLLRPCKGSRRYQNTQGYKTSENTGSSICVLYPSTPGK